MEPEWVTIKEAADRLRRPARTVRDYAGRLAEADRRRVGPNPLQVRYAALLAYLSPPEAPPEPAPMGPAEPGGSGGESGLLVDLLRSEVTFLRERLEERAAAEAELRRLMMADKTELSALREMQRIPAGRDGEKRGDSRPWWKFWRSRR